MVGKKGRLLAGSTDVVVVRALDDRAVVELYVDQRRFFR